jgi:hypothetical protein
MKQRWTEEQIWEWYNNRPWITGCNFIPHNIINSVELWQEQDHEEVMKGVEFDIKLAADLGLNSFRMGLPPMFVWEHQHDGLMKRYEDFLTMCNNYGITVMPLFSGDCLVPKDVKRPEPYFGKQPDPVPGHFGGSAITPFDGTDKVGYHPIADEPDKWAKFDEYVMDFVNRYKNDERIIMWNIFNEAGNSHRGMMSYPFIKHLFDMLREADVSQPLTADVWGADKDLRSEYQTNVTYLTEIEEAVIELSDIITWHYYGDYLHTRQFIRTLKKYNRPLINDEWLHRPMRSVIQTHLPLFKKENVGSYFFGFVNGKNQFNEVWDMIRPYKEIDTSLWMHDVYHSDGTPYDPEEIEVFKKINFEK